MNPLLTVLVVDDEQVVRDYFSSSFPWHSLGMRWIGEAGDGITAFERCRELHPDLLLADITMPGISGLELLAKVNQELPYVNSVLLTCHQDFECVQTALRLGAIDYLVKAATTPDELVAKMAQVRSRVLTKRSKARLSTLQRELLTRLLQSQAYSAGTKTVGELEAELLRLRFPLSNSTCAVMWVSLQPATSALDAYVQHADVYDDQRSQNLLDAFTTGSAQVMWTKLHQGKSEAHQYAIVANIAGVDAFGQLRQLHDQLVETAGEEFVVVAGTSEVVPDLCHLSEALKQAMRAFSAHFYRETETFLLPPPEWRPLSVEFDAGLETLVRALGAEHVKTAERIESLVGSAIDLCREQGVEPEATKLVVLQLVQSNLEEFGYRLSRWEQAIWPMQVEHAVTASQLCEWAVQLVRMVLSQSAATRVRPEIQRVLVLLASNMADPWDLSSMAAIAGMHPNYFSAVFKSEVGQSASEYLARLRMDRAAQYLQEGVWSMQQIANMVGIENYRTFYNTFCRIMGSNPKEFADRIGHVNLL